MKYAFAIGIILILGAAMSLSLIWPEIRQWRRNRRWAQWHIDCAPKPDKRDWQGEWKRSMKP